MPPHRMHETIADELSRATDAQLCELLTSPSDDGAGHRRVEIGGQSVFAKLVPITALELQPEHRESTTNLFGVPAHFHYRIGSRGIGAWRELAAHRLANEWLDSGGCAGLVRLYHARVLPIAPPPFGDANDRVLWGNCPAIEARIDAAESAASSLALFLEYVPVTLLAWLHQELPRAADPGALVADVEREVRDILEFVNAQGVRHMDAHFENLLTDGERILLADFGLTISQSFALEPDERQFVEDHHQFDRLTATTALVHAVISHYAPSDDWRQPLREPERWEPSMPESIRAFLRANTPVALAMGDYYPRLLDDLASGRPTSAPQEP